jgi:hypothetical protein
MSPVTVTLLQAITKQARIPRDYGRERRLAIAGETRRPLVGGNGCSGPQTRTPGNGILPCHIVQELPRPAGHS